MDIVDMIQPFIHLIPRGRTMSIEKFRMEIAKAYDVVGGDQRTIYVYQQLGTIPQNFVVSRKH